MTKRVTIDGNTAAAHVAYAFSEVAAIYPITPSSAMAELCDEYADAGRLNLFGAKVKVSQLQSEAGAAGALHGALAAGALTSTFTASQGLLLMVPNMYKIAGELLPCVFHVSARALAAHALSIFGDHQDVMACRQTGFVMLCSGTVQEVMDLALVAHLATLEARVPFLHFFDGFRTSHEVNKIEEIDYADMDKLLDRAQIDEFKRGALNPEHPHLQGTAQNPDIYFQNREASNKYYAVTPEIVERKMRDVERITGRKYNLFDYTGAADAEEVVVVMGSAAETVAEASAYLNTRGKKTGVVAVRLYRPFAVQKFVASLPKTVKKIAVLDRTKEAGSVGGPLYLDAVAALAECGRKIDTVVGGRYGLGSKEFTPSMALAVYKNLAQAMPKNNFTVGIIDDVTHTSLDFSEYIDVADASTTRCKFYGIGSDGTVGANKNSIKIIGDYTDLFAQGYFEYDSKKSGGLTISHLRFGKKEIKSSYLIDTADFVACHKSSYLARYDMLSSLKKGGTFLLNCPWSAAELEKELPAAVKREIAQKNLNFYIIDGNGVAKSVGNEKAQNVVMQAAFFKLANILPYDEAEKHIKDAIVKTYGKRGDAVIEANFAAVEAGAGGAVKVYVPKAWAEAKTGAPLASYPADKYCQGFIKPILEQKGDTLPVSGFDPKGIVPTGTTKFEKRGIATVLPQWLPENCIQCNQCAFVCPHAVIRPVVIAAGEKTPESFKTIKAAGIEGGAYRMQISPEDCTGCASCANICPAKNKALVMRDAPEVFEAENYAFSQKVKRVAANANKFTVKGSQFEQPLFEFSGACAGCGETPYIKLVTQLFGDRMTVANATGCSSIYGGSAPTVPYCKNAEGKGPAWANSLFEDNAEFGYGMSLAYDVRRGKIRAAAEKLAETDFPAEWDLTAAAKEWLAAFDDGEKSKAASARLLAAAKIADNECGSCGCECDELYKIIINNADMLVKKSVWIVGGDGWAYDIGYGGLDHVLASGANVNVLVLDTEVYSNTGGQASKSSPTGSVAKFAAGGKMTKKKDLGLMAMSYGYVYVAQVAMGANYAQLVKALQEAESYNGPSLVIAYATCINHGMDMTNGMAEMKSAVDCGYWQLYRYNPTLEAEEKNPFTLDSAEQPSGDYQAFLMQETRYSSLMRKDPERAKALFEKGESDAKAKIGRLKRLK